MQKTSRIHVAGHRGLVGSALVRLLEANGYNNLLLRTSAELDLCDQQAVEAFYAEERPEYVILAAARVGGIHANNSYPADFIRENLQIAIHVIDAAYRNGVKKFLFLGSSCIYPKYAPQPLKEEYLLTGALEPTNECYATAKIAGIKMCQAYQQQYGFNAICLMPTNLYGPDDNFDLKNSHVLPALIRKFHLARLAADGDIEAIQQDEVRFGCIPDDTILNLGLSRSSEGALRLTIHTSCQPKVVLWGSGNARREFLHVDDLADASFFLMKLGPGANEADSDIPLTVPNLQYPSILNVGVGKDISIQELAGLVQRIVGFDGEIAFDPSKPDGTPRKLLDVSRLTNLGWKAGTKLENGIERTYSWYKQCQD